MERCLRQLEFQLEQLNQEAVVEDEATKNSFPFVRAADYLNSPSSYGAFQDTSIPYPRTSGSRYIVLYYHTYIQPTFLLDFVPTAFSSALAGPPTRSKWELAQRRELPHELTPPTSPQCATGASRI